MQSVILLFPKITLPQDLVKLFTNLGNDFYSTETGRYIIENEDDYVAVTLDRDIGKEYEMEELKAIPFHIDTFILFEYSRLKFAKKALEILTRTLQEFWIDVGDAEFIDNQKFFATLKENPEWDWR